MENIKRFDLCFVGQFYHLADAGMAPADLALIFRIGVGGVGNQGIGAGNKLGQAFDVMRVMAGIVGQE